MPPLWVLFGVVSAFWLAYMIRPFLRREGEQEDARRRLIEDKRGYLFALRDAELDFEGGKLSAADFEAVRARLEEKAARVIQNLDEIDGGSPEQRVQHALEKLRKRGA